MREMQHLSRFFETEEKIPATLFSPPSLPPSLHSLLFYIRVIFVKVELVSVDQTEDPELRLAQQRRFRFLRTGKNHLVKVFFPGATSTLPNQNVYQEKLAIRLLVGLGTQLPRNAILA